MRKFKILSFMLLATVFTAACTPSQMSGRYHPGVNDVPESDRGIKMVPEQRIHRFGRRSAERMAAIEVLRDKDDLQCDLEIRVDGHKAATLKSGEFVRLWVAPGGHRVKRSDCRHKDNETRMQTYTDDPLQLRMTYSDDGMHWRTVSY